MIATQENQRFELKESKSVEVVEYAVLLDGVKLGVVERAGCYSGKPNWHAHFMAGEEPGRVLIQGHGPTPEDAISSAFMETRIRHEQALVDIDELRAVMMPAGGEEAYAEF